MKLLLAIAFLSVVSALPRPNIPDFIDFRPLIVPYEMIENAEEPSHVHVTFINFDSGVAVNFVDSANEEVPEGTAVNFVDTPINEEVNSDDDGVAIRFVNSVNEEQADDGIAVRFVDNEEENLADDAGAAANFVNSPLNEEMPADDSGIAVKFVDFPTNEGDVVRVADVPIEVDDGTAIKIVDSPINEESSDDTKSIPRYPGKIYDNPMLR